MDFGTPSNDTYGRGMQNVEGYYTEVNRRTNPKGEFNNIDRAWRSEYLKSMKLTSSDAVRTDLELTNPDYYKARYNIFRRIYRAPGHFIHKNILNKMFSPDMAYKIRGCSAVFAGMVMFGWVSMHYALYRGNDWSSNFGWKVFHSKPVVVPGSVHWPKMEAYQRNSKRDYGVGVQHFDHEKMKKCIVTTTPVNGMG